MRLNGEFLYPESGGKRIVSCLEKHFPVLKSGVCLTLCLLFGVNVAQSVNRCFPASMGVPFIKSSLFLIFIRKSVIFDVCMNQRCVRRIWELCRYGIFRCCRFLRA